MIELVCETCGNNRFSFPDDPDDPVICEYCGDSIGTYAEVANRIAEQAFPDS